MGIGDEKMIARYSSLDIGFRWSALNAENDSGRILKVEGGWQHK
jgi:hypothetical protein